MTDEAGTWVGSTGTESTGIGAFEKRVVLVTGGARGIGLACARQFVSQGHDVAVTYNMSEPPKDGIRDPVRREVAEAGGQCFRCRRGGARERRRGRLQCGDRA